MTSYTRYQHFLEFSFIFSKILLHHAKSFNIGKWQLIKSYTDKDELISENETDLVSL